MSVKTSEVEPVWGENGVMRPANYEVLFDVEDDHWWFVGRRAIVFALIEKALGVAPVDSNVLAAEAAREPRALPG